MAQTIDFAFTNHGTIVLMLMGTDAAKEFAADHIDTADSVTLNPSEIPMEPRFAQNLASDLYHEHGFSVSIDGRVANAQREDAA